MEIQNPTITNFSNMQHNHTTGAQGGVVNRGITGAAGAKGTTGSAGAQGHTGHAGTTGTKGTTGSKGTTGTKGATGTGLPGGGSTGNYLRKNVAGYYWSVS